MFCSQCGKRMPQNSRFCYACGNEVNNGFAVTNNSTYSGNLLRFGNGVKAWLCICAVWYGLSALLCFDAMSSTAGRILWQFASDDIRTQVMLSLLIAVAMCICFIVLLASKKRAPFYLLAILASISFIMSATGGVNIVIAALLTLSDAVITYIVLRKYWPYMGASTSYQAACSNSHGTHNKPLM